MRDPKSKITARMASFLSVRIWSILFLMALSLVGASAASAQSPQPVIFFTDIQSGPNSGGETVSGFAGAYVAIYGNFFGSSQGSSTITLNGANCLRVVSWGSAWLWYQKIVVQLGSSCASGNFSISVGGQASTNAIITINGGTINPSKFTVRSGNIRCVSTSGSDSNSGAFPSCWSTLPKAVHAVAAGDTIYVESGVTASGQDPIASFNAVVAITSAGTSTSPIALLAYPGATPVINTSQQYGIRTPQISGTFNNWVIAGFSITTTASDNPEAFNFFQGNFRLVANTFSCPNGTGQSACAEIGGNLNFMYGSNVNNVGTSNSDKTYHAIYFSEQNDHTEVGWNSVQNVRGCRGIQFFQSGFDSTDLHVHDNLIHDIKCDAINFATVNPDGGTVEAYNNVMYNVGKGPDPHDGSANYACINIEANNNHTTPAQLYNNTCLNGGDPTTADPSDSGGYTVAIPSVLRNNLVYQTNGQPYLGPGPGCGHISSGSKNNAFFGNGGAPSCSGMSGSLTANPLVVSTSTPDLHLQSGSPMIGAASTPAPALDFEGKVRTNPGAVGAYEFSAGVAANPKPNPPTSPSLVVH